MHWRRIGANLAPLVVICPEMNRAATELRSVAALCISGISPPFPLRSKIPAHSAGKGGPGGYVVPRSNAQWGGLPGRVLKFAPMGCPAWFPGLKRDERGGL